MAEAVRHYLLRVWREGHDEQENGEWRASLRNVKDGKVITFSEPEALMRFLDGAAPQAAPPSHG